MTSFLSRGPFVFEEGNGREHVVAEFQIVARREREYTTKRGTVVKEDSLVLFESGTDVPLTHTVDYVIPEAEKGGKFPLGSKIRIGITEFATAEFGRRLRVVGKVMK